MEIREVKQEESFEIITKREPRGLFWQKDGDIYVAIDNTTGDAWTQDFANYEDCLAWLQGRE